MSNPYGWDDCELREHMREAKSRIKAAFRRLRAEANAYEGADPRWAAGVRYACAAVEGALDEEAPEAPRQRGPGPRGEGCIHWRPPTHAGETWCDLGRDCHPSPPCLPCHRREEVPDA